MVLQPVPTKRWSVERRSTRLELAVPVLVYGWALGDGEPFTELTKTLAVNVHGGLLALTAPVQPSQILLIVNNKTGLERHCRVVSVERECEGKGEVGIEFVRPEWQFWGLVYDVSQRSWQSGARAARRNVA
jgi:hypothetical protein